MIYKRKKIGLPSAFKQAKLFGGTTATITFTLDTPADPGDTIFVIIRNGNATGLLDYTGWTLLGSVTNSLYALVRTVDATDNGTYTYTWSGTPNNFAGHAMVAGATLGYQQFSLTSFSNQLVCTLPSISVNKNSTILLYFTSTGNANGATSSVISEGYTIALSSGFNLQSLYKYFTAAISEGITLTWSPGTGPAITRMIRLEILGLN